VVGSHAAFEARFTTGPGVVLQWVDTPALMRGNRRLKST
jgi:hypothetical protein